MSISLKIPPSPQQESIYKRKLKPSLLVGFTSRKNITGLALAFDLLIAGFEKQSIPYRLVDFGNLGLAKQAGVFNIKRVFKTLLLLSDFCKKLLGTQGVYILVASSKFGFIRDAFMIWMSCLFNRHLVLHLNGGGYKGFFENQPVWFQRFITKTISQADKIIVLGERLRNQFAFVHDKEEKICIVPNGLPLNLHPASSIQAKKISLDSPIYLLYLSNLIESKGYLVLLEACKILYHEKGLPIKCNFCGQFTSTINDKSKNSKEAKSHFNNLIAQWNLEQVVQYRGIVQGKEKEQLLNQSHMLILPTTYPWEGQPICIIEAMAYGTPVIATPHRGIPEEVINGYNGFLSEATPKQIANAIERLCQNPTRYQQFSKHALKHFATHFTAESYTDRLIPIIINKKN